MSRFEIDQKKLCKYCRDYYDMPVSWKCDGSECSEIVGTILDKVGIMDSDPEKKTFSKLSIGDTIYILCVDSVIPVIRIKKTNSLSAVGSDKLMVHYESIGTSIDDIESSRQGDLFLQKEDCKDAFDVVCTERMVRLAKAMGGE